MKTFLWSVAGLLVLATLAVAQGQGGAFNPFGQYTMAGAGYIRFPRYSSVTGALQVGANNTPLLQVTEAGNVALDGSNPTSVTMSPLTAIDGCSVTMLGTGTPGIDPLVLTVVTNASAGRMDIYAWAATATGNVTMTASSSTRQVSYTCAGR